MKNSISTRSNNQEAEETIENYNRYIEEVQSELVKQEQYEWSINVTNIKSVKEGVFLLKKNNELRKGGYLKSFHKDIMKVAFLYVFYFYYFLLYIQNFKNR